MKRCPKCRSFSIDYDPYRGVYMCMVDGCSCVILDETSYSYLKPDPSTRTINRIKVEEGSETTIIKKYNMA